MAERPLPDTGASGRTSRDRSPVNWLLLVPLLLVVWPPLYNKVDPKLFGIPFFYWFQLLVIGISVVCTLLVYRATANRGSDR
ncbi:MAG TPA: DUF3311 domain-containing protein [Kineosporiaceae bacterium]|nr:DUF3311 domain-containing protein [Kineosporiaceae bacterium]